MYDFNKNNLEEMSKNDCNPLNKGILKIKTQNHNLCSI